MPVFLVGKRSPDPLLKVRQISEYSQPLAESPEPFEIQFLELPSEDTFCIPHPHGAGAQGLRPGLGAHSNESSVSGGRIRSRVDRLLSRTIGRMVFVHPVFVTRLG